LGRAGLGHARVRPAAGGAALTSESFQLAIIQQHAVELGLTLGEASVDVEFKRDAEDGTRYEYIAVHARLPGIERSQAQALLDRFTAKCPIYNTLRRGGNVWAELRGEGA
jgi:uncharacterized OsmC-like protein